MIRINADNLRDAEYAEKTFGAKPIAVPTSRQPKEPPAIRDGEVSCRLVRAGNLGGVSVIEVHATRSSQIAFAGKCLTASMVLSYTSKLAR
jgi:hypothetical protein